MRLDVAEHDTLNYLRDLPCWGQKCWNPRFCIGKGVVFWDKKSFCDKCGGETKPQEYTMKAYYKQHE